MEAAGQVAGGVGGHEFVDLEGEAEPAVDGAGGTHVGDDDAKGAHPGPGGSTAGPPATVEARRHGRGSVAARLGN